MSSGPEKAVARLLTQRYEEMGKPGRPVKKADENLDVNISLSPFGFSMEDGFINVASFFLMSWKDPFLAWDSKAKEYEGVHQVCLPSDSIWTPDVVAWNDWSQNMADHIRTMRAADALITEDGTVMWVPKVNFKVSLKQKANEQSGSIMIGSWAYDTSKIALKFDKNPLDMSFAEKGQCELVDQSAEMEDKEYDICPGLTYRNAKYTFVFKKSGKGGL